MIPGRSVIASIPVGSLQAEEAGVTSMAVLQLPVDYYMEDLPQFRALGRTFEQMRGRGGERVRVTARKAGRLAGPAPSSKTTTNGRGYD